MRIFLANGHSVLNSGDAAIIAAQLGLLGELLPAAAVTMTSRTPDLDAALFGAPGLEILPPLLPARGLSRGRRRRRDSLRALRACDLVLASGGGYFWSHRAGLPGPVFLQNAAPLVLARRFRKPVVFLPQSFGPVRGRVAARLLRACLAGPGVRAILAREGASLEFVRGLLGTSPNSGRAELCPDAAFLLERSQAEAAPRAAPNGERPVLAVTVRRWDFAGSKRSAGERDRAYREAMVAAGRGFVQRFGGSVLLFAQSRGPWPFEDDRPITADVAAALARELPPGRVAVAGLPEAPYPREVIDLLAGADALLATRLHSAILGLITGLLPVVAGYQPKSAGTLGLLGLADRVLPIDCFDPERAIELAGAALAESAGERAARLSALARLRETVRERVAAALEPWREAGRS